MADENQARVYGMADPANRHPPAAQGMRGEKASTRPGERDPEFSRPVTLEGGNTVTVSEGSGVAFAEATGRAGAKPNVADDEQEWPRGFGSVPALAGLALAAGIIAFAFGRLSARASRI